MTATTTILHCPLPTIVFLVVMSDAHLLLNIVLDTASMLYRFDRVVAVSSAMGAMK